MKRLNNSQPLAVTTTYRPLNTAMHIEVLGGLSAVQFYRQTVQQWIPDHSVVPVIDQHGTQTDGALRLKAVYSIIDPDNNLNTDTLVPQIFWYVNGVQVTSTDSTQDYYIAGNILYVRKNFTHQLGANIYCECRFTDTRTSSPFVLSDTLPLSAILQADEQWSINILCDRTRKHFPLHAATTIYTFEAEARQGSADKTDAVAWFWDYSVDNGVNWLTINNDCLWYVSGKNTATLSIDADFIDNLMVRCRIGIADGTSTAAPDLPNEATACIAWRYPKVIPTVFSYGGDRVFAENSFMTFGLIVHVAKHDDMTLEQKRHWLMCDWAVRRQGSNDDPVPLGAYGLEVVVPRQYIYDNAGTKFIVDPRCSIRGPYDILADPSGEVFQSASGHELAVRT
ncbi:MAG: hypothetical protein K6E94_06050 [Elusimicrobiaceae bacterium]|nr:hypothetical protein [Elusimicrobiaceae bacterium]